MYLSHTFNFCYTVTTVESVMQSRVICNLLVAACVRFISVNALSMVAYTAGDKDIFHHFRR